MIKNSFLFLERFGQKKEAQLWEQGITHWNDFLDAENVRGVSTETKPHHDYDVKTAKDKLFLEDYDYFVKRMPAGQQWRLYQLLKDECVFLDIETSGYYGDITVVGLYNGYDTKLMVKGFNLNRELLQEELSKYKMIITFNGASFDLPVIKRYFNIEFPPVHVDLRHVCSKLGYVGGLKNIEKELGISRGGLGDMCGEDAVYLWQMWESTREQKHLDKLLAYNEEDIINLKPIAEKMIKELWQKTFLP